MVYDMAAGEGANAARFEMTGMKSCLRLDSDRLGKTEGRVVRGVCGGWWGEGSAGKNHWQHCVMAYLPRTLA